MVENNVPAGDRFHPAAVMRGRSPHARTAFSPAGSGITYLFLILLAVAALQSCERPSPVVQEEKRTLTEDERYIVKLYMKITEIEENLQDNPDLREKKWSELGREFDPQRIRRILEEIEKDPTRWLAIYGRINELLKRREQENAT